MCSVGGREGVSKQESTVKSGSNWIKKLGSDCPIVHCHGLLCIPSLFLSHLVQFCVTTDHGRS